MGVSDKNVNFRASEQTLNEIADIQKLFHPFLPDRSGTLRWIVRTMWQLLFTDRKLIELFREWQVISGNASQHVQQLSIKFPPAVGANPGWFPKFGGQ